MRRNNNKSNKMPAKRMKNKGSMRPRARDRPKNVRTVSAPVTKGSVINTGKQPSVRVKRREFVTDVSQTATDRRGNRLFRLIGENRENGPLTFLAEFAGNLGLTQSFPWISQLANKFERYVVHMMEFDYEPSCPTSTSGTLALCPNYNSGDTTVVQSKQDALGRVDTVRGPVWSKTKCKLDPKKLNGYTKESFIREDAVPSGQDVKTFDKFKLDALVETTATNADETLGELWVNYDVELLNPLPAQDSTISQSSAWYWDSTHEFVNSSSSDPFDSNYTMASVSASAAVLEFGPSDATFLVQIREWNVEAAYSVAQTLDPNYYGNVDNMAHLFERWNGSMSTDSGTTYFSNQSYVIKTGLIGEYDGKFAFGLTTATTTAVNCFLQVFVTEIPEHLYTFHGGVSRSKYRRRDKDGDVVMAEPDPERNRQLNEDLVRRSVSPVKFPKPHRI